MIPLRDNVPHLHKPLLTFALIVFNLLVFVWELSFSPENLQLLTYYLGLVPARYTEPIWAALVGLEPVGWFPFITNIFLHGGWLHVLTNMWMLWIFGRNVEEKMGATKFLLFYLICGLVASLTHFFSDPISHVPVIGASGAIAGVMGAYFRMYPRARIHTFFPVLFFPIFFQLPAVIFLGLWFLLQLFYGTAALVGTQAFGGIAFWAHVGGFVTGFLVFPFFLSRRRLREFEHALATSRLGSARPVELFGSDSNW